MKNTEQLRKAIQHILETQTSLVEEEGMFRGEIYVDSYDELSQSSLRTLSTWDNKSEAFDEMMNEFCFDASDFEEIEILNILEKHWDGEEYGAYETNSDTIQELAREMVEWTFPVEQYLNQQVCVNIVVDTGDRDMEFTCNNLSNYYAQRREEESDDEFIEEESSLLWLIRQQGYKREQLADAVRRKKYHDSSLLESVDIESQNTTTSTNALAFFVKMSIKDFIKLSDDSCSLILDKQTPCGLYDSWNGAGGPLEIELEKDVVLPNDKFKAYIEGTHGYSVDGIYGMMSSFWKETIKEMNPSTEQTN